MKKNEKMDLKSKTVDELSRMEVDLRGEILKIKTEASLKKAKNTNALRLKTKDLARVLTVLSMKTVSVESGADQVETSTKSEPVKAKKGEGQIK